MRDLLTYIGTGGLPMYLTLLLSLILLFAGIVLLFTIKLRTTARFYALLALTPALSGLGGTAIDFLSTGKLLWSHTYTGLAGTLLLLLLSLVLVARSGKE